MTQHYSCRLNELNSHFQGKGPFFTQFSDEIVAELSQHPENHLHNGEVVIRNFGIFNCYSRKVFVGGLPLDITEREYQKFFSIKNGLPCGSVWFFNPENVIETFKKFGPLIVDWPYKEDTNSAVPPKGFAFLLFEVRIYNPIFIKIRLCFCLKSKLKVIHVCIVIKRVSFDYTISTDITSGFCSSLFDSLKCLIAMNSRKRSCVSRKIMRSMLWFNTVRNVITIITFVFRLQALRIRTYRSEPGSYLVSTMFSHR